MSYTPTNWQAGDIITAAKLNNMESGIANGGSFVLVPFHYDDETDSLVLEMTWQEIFDGMSSGTRYCFKNLVDNYGGWSVRAPFLSEAKFATDDGEGMYFVNFTDIYEFWTYTTNGYPACYIGD